MWTSHNQISRYEKLECVVWYFRMLSQSLFGHNTFRRHTQTYTRTHTRKIDCFPLHVCEYIIQTLSIHRTFAFFTESSRAHRTFWCWLVDMTLSMPSVRGLNIGTHSLGRKPVWETARVHTDNRKLWNGYLSATSHVEWSVIYFPYLSSPQFSFHFLAFSLFLFFWFTLSSLLCLVQIHSCRLFVLILASPVLG